MNSTHAQSRIYTGRWEPKIHKTITFMNLLITVLGITANGFTSLIIISKRVEPSRTNMLLLNLSIVDIIGCLSLYPFFFVDFDIIAEMKSFKNGMCTITSGLQPFFWCVAVNLLTLTIMAIHRFIGTTFPLRPDRHLTRRGIFRSLCATWIFSMVIMVPSQVSMEFDDNLGLCTRVWPKNINGPLYALMIFSVGLFLPLVTLVSMFLLILHNYRLGVKSKFESVRRQWKRRKQAVVVLGALILNFVICLCPYFIYWAFSGSNTVFATGPLGHHQRLKYLRIVVLFVSCNFVSDPVLYGFICREFRTAAFRMFRRDVADG